MHTGLPLLDYAEEIVDKINNHGDIYDVSAAFLMWRDVHMDRVFDGVFENNFPGFDEKLRRVITKLSAKAVVQLNRDAEKIMRLSTEQQVKNLIGNIYCFLDKVSKREESPDIMDYVNLSLVEMVRFCEEVPDGFSYRFMEYMDQCFEALPKIQFYEIVNEQELDCPTMLEQPIGEKVAEKPLKLIEVKNVTTIVLPFEGKPDYGVILKEFMKRKFLISHFQQVGMKKLLREENMRLNEQLGLRLIRESAKPPELPGGTLIENLLYQDSDGVGGPTPG
jgi:hypothetical protein